MGGPSHLTGTLSFPNKRFPVSCYFLHFSDLAHSLFGVSRLIRLHGHAIFTNSSCSFFGSPSAALPFLTGVKALEADLWHLSVPSVPRLPTQPHLQSISPSPSAFFSMQSLPAARFVAYWHHAFGSPSLSTFRRALKQGFIRSIPYLTHHLVAKYLPLSLPTSFGHLDLLRKNISSSRPKIPPSCLGPVASLPPTRRASPRLAAIHDSFPPDHSLAHTVHRSEWSAAGLSGRFPIPSHLGSEYILVFNHLGYIHFVSFQSRTSSSYVSAFRLAAKFFASLSHPLRYLKIDNVTSADLETFFPSSQPPIHFQLVPPFNHRANKAERSIRTGKNHFLSVLSAAHITFPPNRWSDLLPITELTFNHLRSSLQTRPSPPGMVYTGLPWISRPPPSTPPDSLWWSTTRPLSASHGTITAFGASTSPYLSFTIVAIMFLSPRQGPLASPTP